MATELEFLPVGDESKGGDAIILHLGDPAAPRSARTIIVIDGGYKANGQDIVDRIRSWYGTDVVDLVVSTHPDRDHISGLCVVIEQLDVRELWMHLPWRHSEELAALRAHAFESTRLSEKVEASLRDASSLELLARSKGIPITEPFTGVSAAGGQYVVLGPDVEFYREQLAQIPESGAAKVAAALSSIAKGIVRFVEDRFTDRLSDDAATSPRNNTSVVSLVVDGAENHACLLTADAGIPALERVIPRLRTLGISSGELDLVQVPHHGSRRNVGPKVLDEILGSTGVIDDRGSAVVSCPAKNPEGKHPAKRVTNAFSRRGYPVVATAGQAIFYSSPKVNRAGYGHVDPLPFYEEYEDEEDDE